MTVLINYAQKTINPYMFISLCYLFTAIFCSMVFANIELSLNNYSESNGTADIYYNSGNVGIGTSTNIVERLVVNGGIKLAKTIQSGFVVPGTIEFDNVVKAPHLKSGYQLL